MGKAFNLSVRTCVMTMKLRVMCDQASESPSSLLHDGDNDSTPVISMGPTFENVETLKANLSIDSQDQDLLCDSTNLLNKKNNVDSDNKSDDGLIADLCSSTKLLDCDSGNGNLSTGDNVTSFVHPVNGAAACSSISIDDDCIHLKNNSEGAENSSNGKACCEVSSSSFQNNSQDFPIDVSSSSSARFSRVLENISLPLLYIPTTKQLVANTEEQNISQAEKSKPEDHISQNPQMNRDYLYSSNRQDFQFGSDLINDHQESGVIRQTSSDSLSDIERLPSVENFTESTTPCDTYHLFPDNISISSRSTCTDFSVSAFSVGDDNFENRSLSHFAEDAVFMDVNLHSRNSFDRTSFNHPLAIEGHQSLGNDQESPSTATKKKTSAFKNIFGKKVKDDSTPGWKFFGKIPPKTVTRDPHEIKSEIEARRQKTAKEKPQQRKEASEVLSTTALILENRPENLPTKNPEEEERHKQQYNQMIEAAKKKEQKDLRLKKKRLQQQRKLEDKLMTFAQTWVTNILPNWDSSRQTKKVRELWWLGLPSNVRGQVWMLAIGNDLNITHELYEICHKRAEDKIKLVIQSKNNDPLSGQQQPSTSHDKEDSVNVIKLDVSRTFPHLGIFQKGGPYHDLLHSLLGAYACYRPDVGYVQGMSFIAAILLLNMEVANAFVCFANLLNRPCQLTFFRMDENIMSAYYKTFDAFFKENLPRLHAHVVNHNVTPNLYLMEWVFLLYSKSLPLDVACRVWDLFCRDGEEFLFRAAIGILKLYEHILIKMDFIHMAQFLTKLPEDISSEELFHELEGIQMNIDKRGFNAVHAFYKDLHESST